MLLYVTRAGPASAVPAARSDKEDSLAAGIDPAIFRL